MSSTTFAEPEREWPFQEIGEVCLSCCSIWENQSPPKPPKDMVGLYHNDGAIVRTDEKNIEIVICPWCDGDAIVRLNRDL